MPDRSGEGMRDAAPHPTGDAEGSGDGGRPHQGPLLPDWFADLDSVAAEAWRRLVRGAADRKSAFHTMTVATVRADGAATARTVVLRGVDPARRVLRFHTDRRAPKLGDLARDPRVCLLLYDHGAKIQLRLDGVAEVAPAGELTDRLWAGTRPQGRAVYAQVPAPGTLLDDPADGDAAEDETFGRGNFTPVEVRVTRLDLLYLHVAGHRRAVFDWTDGAVAAAWIAP